jgi:hypothetical protein
MDKTMMKELRKLYDRFGTEVLCDCVWMNSKGIPVDNIRRALIARVKMVVDDYAKADMRLRPEPETFQATQEDEALR